MAGGRLGFALREAGISQFLFLILFSCAFFFEGYTGLVVTVGAILTLAALMQITAKVNWAEVFRRGRRRLLSLLPNRRRTRRFGLSIHPPTGVGRGLRLACPTAAYGRERLRRTGAGFPFSAQPGIMACRDGRPRVQYRHGVRRATHYPRRDVTWGRKGQ